MPEFSVTVLGAGPAWPNPGGACSGYLVSSGPDYVLMECGFGILSRLRQHLPLDRLKAVVISHLHADHFMDLVPLRYGLKYGRLRSDPRLPLYAPPGSTGFFRKLGAALDGDEHFFDGTYELAEYSPGSGVKIGRLSFTFQPVKHYIPSFAMVVQDGRRLAFSGDAAPCSSLVNAARDADLFLCEAANNCVEDDDPDPQHRGHLTAGEAGAIAREARVGRLVLTHYRLDEAATQKALVASQEAFGGPVELAQEGQTYVV